MTAPAPNSAAAWLPTDPPRPAPPLLTHAEVILLLRLDTCAKNPLRCLKHYRDTGQLRGIKLGKRFLYRLQSVLEFLERRERGETNE